MSTWMDDLHSDAGKLMTEVHQLVGPEVWPWLQAIGLGLLGFLVYLTIKGTVIRLIRDAIIRWQITFGSYLIKHSIFKNLLKLFIVVGSLQWAATSIHDPLVAPAVAKLGQVLFILIAAQLVFCILDAGLDILQHRGVTKKLPIKSLVQLGKIITVLICGIVLIAALMGKSPMYLLSGLGALSAVLLLVFKDSLLGLTAGLQITGNRMLEIGHWVEIDGADGEVIDISLQTVKIRNWDNTVSSIPTYQLVSRTLKNWAPMSAKARRIKRAIWIDVSSIRFLTEGDLDKLRQVRLLGDYLPGKLKAINVDAKRQASSPDAQALNQRQLTNIGTFRAYVEAYLRQHPEIHLGETLLVRQKPPTATGLPVELYCFTHNTEWAHYEGVQADIFDHLMAVLPEFGLRAFQQPSGQDWQALAGRHGSGEPRA